VRLTLDEIAAAAAGRVLQPGPTVTGVGTDSRTIRPGDLFVALCLGERDGHLFVPDAAQQGAAGALVSRVPDAAPTGFGVVVVPDTLLALGRLGSTRRGAATARVLAITGSVGKTSAKGMLGAILERLGPTVTARASYNNEIGVPLTLLELEPEHRFCVLELATRNPGDIAYLAGLARPEVGVVTGIGTSHLVRFGTREAIARAKGELLERLPPHGAAVLPQDEDFRDLLTGLAPCRVTTFGRTPEADVWAAVGQSGELRGLAVTLHAGGESQDLRLRVPGSHNALNAAAAAAAALAVGADLQGAAEGLAAFDGVEMRCRIVPGVRGTTVIDDAYNAAPDSVRAALELLATAPGRRLFVFGDMLELGEAGPAAHEAVGELAAELGVARLYALGELAERSVEAAGKLGVPGEHFGSGDDLLAALLADLRAGDMILVKGSRAMHLERIVRGIVSRE